MSTKIMLQSVQSLLIQMAFGDQVLSTGTGFVCQSPKGPALVTNWHNLSGRHPQTKKPLSTTGGIPDNIRIIHNKHAKLGEWLEVKEPIVTGGVPLWKEHPTLASRFDVVALPLTNLTGVQLYPYDLKAGPDIVLCPTEMISVVGFPFGIQAGGSLAVWATGFVASEPAIDFDGLPIFLVDCRTRPGQSGSAVIAHRNSGMVPLADGTTSMFAGPVTRFLGVYSGRLNEESDLGIVWKSAALEILLASV